MIGSAAESEAAALVSSGGVGLLRVRRSPAQVVRKGLFLGGIERAELVKVSIVGHHTRAVSKFGEALAAALEAQCHLGVFELRDRVKGWEWLFSPGASVGGAESGRTYWST